MGSNMGRCLIRGGLSASRIRVRARWCSANDTSATANPLRNPHATSSTPKGGREDRLNHCCRKYMHSISSSSAVGGRDRFRVVRLDRPDQRQPRNHPSRLKIARGHFTARVPGQRRECPLCTHCRISTPTIRRLIPLYLIRPTCAGLL